MNKPKIGDIFEIPTKKGLAYAQYTHEHRTHGSLLRIFDAMFQTRPRLFSDLVKSYVRFSIFFPLVVAIRRGIFEIVAHEEIVPENMMFPLFRNGVLDPKTKKVAVWWFWDGEKEWKVGAITPEQRKMPIAAVWNDTLLVQRIEEDWRPESDFGGVP